MNLTLLIVVLLGVAQYQKWRHGEQFSASGRIIYYLLAFTSLTLAVLDDIDIDIPLPADWLKQLVDEQMERLVKRGGTM